MRLNMPIDTDPHKCVRALRALALAGEATTSKDSSPAQLWTHSPGQELTPGLVARKQTLRRGPSGAPVPAS